MAKATSRGAYADLCASAWQGWRPPNRKQPPHKGRTLAWQRVGAYLATELPNGGWLARDPVSGRKATGDSPAEAAGNLRDALRQANEAQFPWRRR